MSDEMSRRGLAYVAISNFDEATGTKRTPEQFADTEDAISKILSEIEPETVEQIEAHRERCRALMPEAYAATDPRYQWAAKEWAPLTEDEKNFYRERTRKFHAKHPGSGVP